MGIYNFVYEVTYTVSGGTLNPTYSLIHFMASRSRTVRPHDQLCR